ncbi:MAG: SRPBCC family protein [Rhizobiales bacterium]|nr:SRPBCC family protein [Hyphomicrobiales bacterium]
MTVLTIVGAILAIAIVIVLILAAMKPDTFVVQRSTLIDAPGDTVYRLINDYKNWASWSPYEKIDPAMKRKYSGAPVGVGSIYEWEGNKNIGSGRMEILDSSPSRIDIKLDFMSPFEAHNKAEFTMKPEGNATNVTWTMRGPIPYKFKIMHVIFNMDKMVGNQFAEGLANMKRVAEGN